VKSLVLGGATLAAAAGAIYAGLEAKSAAKHVLSRCPSKRECDPSLAAVKDRSDRYMVASNALWVTSTLGLLATLVAMAHELRPASGQAKVGAPAWGLACSERACRLDMQGRF
jgi:hypothetical protein